MVRISKQLVECSAWDYAGANCLVWCEDNVLRVSVLSFVGGI